MLDIIYSLSNSITGYTEAIRTLTLDVQNFQTAGYKKTDADFSSLFTRAVGIPGGSSYGGFGWSNSVTLNQGSAYVVRGHNFTQGGLVEQPGLSAAILGVASLFVVTHPNSRKKQFTRSSNWLFDSNGSLRDTQGRQVMGYHMVNGVADKSALVPISIDPENIDLTDLGFESGGILRTNYQARKAALDSGESELPPTEDLFQLGLARFANPNGLRSASGDSYVESPISGPVSGFGVSGEAKFGEVFGGFVEASNVDPAEVSIEGTQLQRGYNAVQGMLTMVNRILQSFIQSVSQFN
ncbi:MAG: flagellar hook basal-body protein [Candidatus Margulisbacteria bacterium]|nr:flagellar hook basal-body protein [Candidatus Margulisiibacteriota bacterium]